MSVRRRSSVLVLCSSLVATLWFVAVPPAGAVNVAHPSVANADPSNLTPDMENGRVNALAQVGNRIIVGGTFTTVQNPGSNTDISRPYIVAFNASTGVVDTGFTPSLNGAVESLAPGPDGTSVFVGGSFTTVNGTGTDYRRLVRLNVSTGAIVPGLQPRPNRVVTDLVVRGPWLYASGEFDVTTPLNRVGLARFNVSTGAMDPNLDIPFTDPNNVPERDPAKDGVMQVWKIDVTPDGSRLIAIGNFNTVGGIHREQLAILDVAAGTPSVTSWQTDVFPFRVPGTPTSSYCNATFPMYLRDIDIAPDGTYFAIVTTGANRPNRLCDSLTRWEMGPTGPGQLPTWFMKTGGDSMHSVSVTGAAIYAGGHQQWANNPFNPTSCGVCTGPFPGGVTRTGISAHDPINGLPFTFNPGRARGKGVLAQLSSNLGIYFGSDTDTIGGETHRKLAFMPLAGGVVVPPNDPYTLARRPVPDGSGNRRSRPVPVRRHEPTDPRRRRAHRDRLDECPRRVRPERARLHGMERRHPDRARLRRVDGRRCLDDRPARARRGSRSRRVQDARGEPADPRPRRPPGSDDRDGLRSGADLLHRER